MPLISRQTWTKENLAQFVAGKRVSVRDRSNRELGVPALLGDHAATVDPYGERFVDATYPEDRGLIVSLYLDALERPGEVLSTRIRVDEDGRWQHLDVQVVNLLDDDRINGLVFTSQPVEGPAVQPTADDDGAGRHPTPWLTWTLDEGGRVRTVAGDPVGLLGYTSDELIGLVPSKLSHPSSRGAAIQTWIDIHENPDTPHAGRRQLQRKDGTWVWIEASYICRSSWPEGEARVLAVLMDVTERRSAEASLRQLAEDFRILADEIETAVFRCTSRGDVTFSNRRWTDLVSKSNGRLTTITDLFDGDEKRRLVELLHRLAHDEAPGSRVSFVGISGQQTWQVDLRRSGGADRDSSIIGTLNDVTDYVALQRSARTDPLTGLANRTVVETTLADDLRQGRDTTVAFIDLDRFKRVNDDHGHDVGDAVLVELARRLAAVVRPSDIVCRWGGDEFVVVFRNADPAHAHELVERLRQTASPNIEAGGFCWVPSFSIGSVVARPGDSADEIVARADVAMYEEKRARRSAAVPNLW